MDIFISFIVFGMAVFLFFMTANKIKNIKSNIIVDDARHEIESLITEFNGAAARNIELLEAKIADLQNILKKSDSKMITMDEKIERMNKPIVVEKIVEKRSSPRKPLAAANTAVPDKGRREEIVPEKKSEDPEKPFIVPLNEMNRTDKLKYLLKTGKTKEDLLGMGFLENEINLISFLIRKGN